MPTVKSLPTEVHRTIDNALAFLYSDLGYSIVNAEVNDELTGRNLLVYRNDNAEKQLEISADDGYFHCEIRRLLNGVPAKYPDDANCIGFEDLAKLESDGQYEHMDYFAGGANRMTGVLGTTAALFRRHRDFLSTNMWVDVQRLSSLNTVGLERVLKWKLDADHAVRLTFFDRLTQAVSELLRPKGYVLVFDNKALAPYHRDRHPDCVTFEKSRTLVEIFQEDWRDTYFMYHIQVNGLPVANINITEGHSDDERIRDAVEKLNSAT